MFYVERIWHISVNWFQNFLCLRWGHFIVWADICNEFPSFHNWSIFILILLSEHFPDTFSRCVTHPDYNMGGKDKAEWSAAPVFLLLSRLKVKSCEVCRLSIRVCWGPGPLFLPAASAFSRMESELDKWSWTQWGSRINPVTPTLLNQFLTVPSHLCFLLLSCYCDSYGDLL